MITAVGTAGEAASREGWLPGVKTWLTIGVITAIVVSAAGCSSRSPCCSRQVAPPARRTPCAPAPAGGRTGSPTGWPDPAGSRPPPAPSDTPSLNQPSPPSRATSTAIASRPATPAGRADSAPVWRSCASMLGSCRAGLCPEICAPGWAWRLAVTWAWARARLPVQDQKSMPASQVSCAPELGDLAVADMADVGHRSLDQLGPAGSRQRTERHGVLVVGQHVVHVEPERASCSWASLPKNAKPRPGRGSRR